MYSVFKGGQIIALSVWQMAAVMATHVPYTRYGFWSFCQVLDEAGKKIYYDK